MFFWNCRTKLNNKVYDMFFCKYWFEGKLTEHSQIWMVQSQYEIRRRQEWLQLRSDVCISFGRPSCKAMAQLKSLDGPMLMAKLNPIFFVSKRRKRYQHLQEVSSTVKECKWNSVNFCVQIELEPIFPVFFWGSTCELFQDPSFSRCTEELNGCALIRELHVYGTLVAAGREQVPRSREMPWAGDVDPSVFMVVMINDYIHIVYIYIHYIYIHIIYMYIHIYIYALYIYMYTIDINIHMLVMFIYIYIWLIIND